MVESLQDGSWVTGWLALLLVFLPVLVSFYNENKARSKLLNDIEIFNKWSEKGDPAGIEFCRMSINSRIEKLYSARHIPIINIILLVICTAILIFSCYVLLNGITEDPAKRLMWVVDFLLYLLIVSIQIRTIRTKLKSSKTNQDLIASVMRQHSKAIKIKIGLNQLNRIKNKNCDTKETLDRLNQEHNHALEELYEVASQLEEIDVEYLKDKYEELTAE